MGQNFKIGNKTRNKWNFCNGSTLLKWRQNFEIMKANLGTKEISKMEKKYKNLNKTFRMRKNVNIGNETS